MTGLAARVNMGRARSIFVPVWRIHRGRRAAARALLAHGSLATGLVAVAGDRGSPPSTTIASGTPTSYGRTFGESRRRTKVIGRLPGAASCLTLVWAVLDRASRG